MSIQADMDKRDKILKATQDLLAKEGFHGLSMQKIAKHAGVAAGTIYRYFDDKEALLKEIRMSVTKLIAVEMQAGVSDDMPLEARFRIMWLNLWELGQGNSKVLNNQVQYESLPQPTTEEEREAERKLFPHVEKMFKQGIAEGVFKPLDGKILFTLSLQTGVMLAKKHAQGVIELDKHSLEEAISASWDAIIQH
ncbi:TetR/AcrR family transcriptional regulator [Vibrio sp. SCSIO 43136]|uniref:TetR/AcrR family transcriptional regulator n=1 Tax=Vibrio sp. SCSIO 43136 TaxID=2819101 RepID=UPI0020750BDE|nr:TetR/AcrR family transcriptional regulator [Vibrio sp. SCSIO 43136]USD65240.1 TetR/AcrR family transcriptional regulator [Vibrio sp. SCSIO 43136]